MISRKKIMVVEDEGITAMSIKNSLNDMGYAVTSVVSSGDDAVRKAGEDKPDLVLMDITLNGEMDGIEAAGHIHTSLNIPVVYITAHANEMMLKRIKETEPSGYIIKPFDNRELLTIVELALYRHEMEKKLRERERELQMHREQLTWLVEERTAELRSSNELLKDEIADRRLAEAEAVRACHLAALGELAAGVAHEINNPINGIINYAQILLNKFSSDSNETDIARRIIKEGDRIAKIVQGLLSFAHENTDIREHVLIHEIMTDSLMLINSLLKKDGIRVKLEIPANPCIIKASPQQLEQVFLNIISNARYAMNEKFPGVNNNKLLTIHCKHITNGNKAYIRIIFHDNGSGIPQEIIDKVLNPFFTTKKGSTGTGLGLSISHNIINRHSGKLSIASVEGEYTEVMIDFPLE